MDCISDIRVDQVKISTVQFGAVKIFQLIWALCKLVERKICFKHTKILCKKTQMLENTLCIFIFLRGGHIRPAKCAYLLVVGTLGASLRVSTWAGGSHSLEGWMGTIRFVLDINLYFSTKRVNLWHRNASFSNSLNILLWW